jgi:adenylyl-sulfate kinase
MKSQTGFHKEDRTMQPGCCVWFTGLPCSGKTTVADLVADELKKRGLKVERLDGDIVRKSLTRDLGFSKEDRDKNIERVTFVAKLLSRNGVAVLVSFVSPYIVARDNARRETTNFVEVFVDTPVEICQQRDVKGMYAKARAGEIKDFTGVDDPYEPPPNPEVVLKAAEATEEQCRDMVLHKLEALGYIPSASAAGADASEGSDVYSKEEEEKIQKRLEDLGYL